MGPVVIVIMQPPAQRLSAFPLRHVMPGIGPPIGECAVEPLDFAVGLRPVRSGPLRHNPHLVAGLGPQRRPVRWPIVTDDPVDGDPTCTEPGHRPPQYAACRHRLFIVVDFGVRHPGVVVDDGVDEAVAHLRVVVGIFRFPRGGGAMASSPCPADEAPSTAVGDVSELGDVDMDGVTRLRVFIAVVRPGFNGG